MLTRWVIAPMLVLTAAGASAESLAKLGRSQMKPGQVYEFRTTGRTYRAEVVDGRSGECLVSASRDGVTFSQPRKTFVLGATQGPASGVSLVIMHEVKVGLGIELAVEDYGKPNRFLTPEVTAITLLDPQAPAAGASNSGSVSGAVVPAPRGARSAASHSADSHDPF